MPRMGRCPRYSMTTRAKSAIKIALNYTGESQVVIELRSDEMTQAMGLTPASVWLQRGRSQTCSQSRTLHLDAARPMVATNLAWRTSLAVFRSFWKVSMTGQLPIY
jgi:hypothetical protein